MVRNQLGLRRPGKPGNLASELGMLSESMRAAVLAANAAYAALGVRYALVGGLAAGMHGEPRFTKDIDFLVGDEAFVRSGMIVSFAKPMPLQAGDVAIDPIPLPDDPRRKAILEAALDRATLDESAGGAVPVLDATALSFMKLASPRAKDLSDVVAMLRSGAADLAQLTRDIADDDALRGRLDAALAELRSEQGSE